MSRIREATRDLEDLIELVFKAMFGIIIVYLIAKALIEIVAGPQAAKIISAVLGIAILFAIVVSKRVRDEILDFGKSKK
ncbi:hypothetical protein ES703_84832 [subsurface metagenome]